MFDYDEPPKEERTTDYTGPIIVAILAPVFLLFVFLDKVDMGLTACIVLGMTLLAIKLRWKLRNHLWFWVIIIFMLALHVPLMLFARWPQGNVPTLVYALPLGIVDFFIILGAIGLVEKLFTKDSPRDGEG